MRFAAVGIDLDNTIVDYAGAFADGAARFGLPVPAGDKCDLRDAIRALPDGENRWRELQAYVYGEGIAGARPFAGVAEFFARAQTAGVALRVISHKTHVAAARPDVDLRAHARGWLERQAFARGVPVTFAETRADKLAAIAASGVTVFVDDLVEVLTDPAFPPAVERWWFAPGAATAAPGVDRRFTDWASIAHAVFGA